VGDPPPSSPDHGRVLHSSSYGFSAVGEPWGSCRGEIMLLQLPWLQSHPKGDFLGKEVFSLEVENNIP